MRTSIAKLAISMSLLSAVIPQISSAENISRQSVTKDITYLASDELNGRASFTKDIDKAADYISKRFKAIGLVPMQGESSFLQSFTVTKVAPASLSVSVNGKSIASDLVTMASTYAEFNWQNSSDMQTHLVGKDDDMRSVISKLNQQGGNHLVLLNSAHAKMFKRYKGYFDRGLTKLSLNESGAIVIAVSDEMSIESAVASGKTSIKQQKLTNVVGVLPGSEKPEEIVLYSAHYDHLGVKLNAGDDKIFNGADDNASGTTAIMNLAQYFAKQGKPKRSLMFAAFTAEEIGGFGSRYFSKQLNPDDVVAMINIEMIGKVSKFGAGQFWMTGMERSSLGQLLNANLPENMGKIHADPYPKQNLFYRSDNATLAKLGVPAHSFSSVQLEGDKHYHQVSDDLASLDLDSMFKVIENLSIATQGLVDGTLTPTRVDVNKVKGGGKIY